MFVSIRHMMCLCVRQPVEYRIFYVCVVLTWMFVFIRHMMCLCVRQPVEYIKYIRDYVCVVELTV